MRIFVVGVGMTKFLKPSDNNPDYPEMASTAVRRALKDAGDLPFSEIQVAAVGYAYGDSTCGQRAIYEVGQTGIPIYNVNNNCATGSSALHLAKKLLEGGVYGCALALGFEKMEKGSLTLKFPDRVSPLDKIVLRAQQIQPLPPGPSPPFAPMLFGNAGLEHMHLFGTQPIHFAKIAAKNHKHSLNNPYSQFQKGYSLDDITKAPKIYEMLTKLQCCPTSDGAAAAILCDEKTMRRLGLEDQAVEILALELTTDVPSQLKNSREIVGMSMTKNAADQAYQKSGVKPSQIGVVELHDCFSANQLITYEALRLCGQGEAAAFIDRGDNTYGGRTVVNPSGGLISKGHPLGATGLAQCSEVVWQLRGIAGRRQVPNLKYGLQHNLGLGGACVVGIYKKYNENKSNGTCDLKTIEESEARGGGIKPKL